MPTTSHFFTKSLLRLSHNSAATCSFGFSLLSSFSRAVNVYLIWIDPKSDSMNVAASIVEHRPLANLPHVILNFLELLPKVVSIYFFCSLESAIFVQSTLKSKLGHEDLRRVLYIEGFFGDLVAVSRMSKLTYNRLLLDHAFWSVFEQDAKDSVLIFEHDTFLCNHPRQKV